jgi:intein/homing endonuclease
MSEYNVDSHLISKKELLSKYGISYGALYRWKRKGLIPEEWFIKKATSTGQETFFPTALVCERIELILKQKEDILLDELAQKLNHEELSNSGLLLSTVFGDKRFHIHDIKEIRIERTDGKHVDITKQIMELIAQYDTNRE